MSKAITRPQTLAIARQHHRAGRLPQAQALYRSILQDDPNDSELLSLLGAVSAQLGNRTVAIEHLSRAAACQPSNAIAQYNLGKVLLEDGRWNDSICALRAAEHLDLSLPGVLLALTAALRGDGQLESSLTSAQRAVAANPNSADALTQLGVTLRELGRLDESIAALSHAAERSKDSGEALSNLGVALRTAGWLDDAVAAYRTSLKFEPKRANTHWNLSIALLTQGNFIEGFAEYEWRWKRSDIALAMPKLPARQWNGEPMPGQTLLLVSEQGFGDSIQFVRFAAEAAARVGRIILACPAPLATLLARAPGITATIPLGDKLPAFHAHCPLLSLPHVLGTTLETIPRRDGYLQTGSDSLWQSRIENNGRKRVGLCWAGRPTHAEDRHRSIDPNLLLPLARLQNIDWFSLQKESQKPERETELRSQLQLRDWMPMVENFEDAAGLVSQLDAVITIDSAIAHLAGALGKPAFVLLPAVSDWRWLRERSDSPWYSSVHLCRQRQMENWGDAIRDAMDGLITNHLAASPLVDPPSGD